MCEAEEVLNRLLLEIEQKSRDIVGHLRMATPAPRSGDGALDTIEETRALIASLQANVSAMEMLDLVRQARLRLKVAGMQVEA